MTKTVTVFAASGTAGMVLRGFTSRRAAFNPAMDIEPDRTKIQIVEITVAWIERD